MSKVYDHYHSIVENGYSVTTEVILYNLDTAPSDSGSLDTDGI